MRKDIINAVAEKTELILLEARELAQVGPHIRIYHRFRIGEVGCQPGEEVFAAAVVHRGHEHYLNLPLALLLLLDYLSHHRRVAQSSIQIEAGFRASAFYAEHGVNAMRNLQMTRSITKAAVKEYVKRLRRALTLAFYKAGLRIDPWKVVLSQPTVTNQVGYRLQGRVEWIHESSPNATGDQYTVQPSQI